MTSMKPFYPETLLFESGLICPVLGPTEILKSDIMDLLSNSDLSSDMLWDDFKISWSDRWHKTSVFNSFSGNITGILTMLTLNLENK